MADNDIVSNADFFAAFPAFNNTAIYPTFEVTNYLALANAQLNYSRWKNLMPMGSMLWAAHFLTMDAADAKAAAGGKLAGSQLTQTSKSVGSVSVSVDTNFGTELDAGHWNLTTFGKRFIRFARMAGMGGVQLN